MMKETTKKGKTWLGLSLVMMIFFLGIAILSGFHVLTDEKTASSPQQTQEESISQAEAPSDDEETSASTDAVREEFAVLNEAEAIASAKNSNEVETEQEREVPITLAIPSIDITADLEPVGVLENGQMGVPSTENGVAWFEPGVKPGEKGNAVMAGHVDSKTGPAIFYELDKVGPGEEIEVTDENNDVLTFTVQRAESYDRNNAPMQDIFGQSDSRNLNLITCAGTFDQAEGTHDERLVVYTELQEKNGQPIEGGEPPESPTTIELNANRLSFHAVRDDDVAGYRIYQEKEKKEDEHVESIATHERKSYSVSDLEGSYYVTTVDINGMESAPSEIVE